MPRLEIRSIGYYAVVARSHAEKAERTSKVFRDAPMQETLGEIVEAIKALSLAIEKIERKLDSLTG